PKFGGHTSITIARQLDRFKRSSCRDDSDGEFAVPGRRLQNFGTEARVFCSFATFSCSSYWQATGSSNRTIELLRRGGAQRSELTPKLSRAGYRHSYLRFSRTVIAQR